MQTAPKLFLTYPCPQLFTIHKVLPSTALAEPPWGPGVSNNSVAAKKPKVALPSRGEVAPQLQKRIAAFPSSGAFRRAFSRAGESTGEGEEEGKPEFLWRHFFMEIFNWYLSICTHQEFALTRFSILTLTDERNTKQKEKSVLMPLVIKQLQSLLSYRFPHHLPSVFTVRYIYLHTERRFRQN